ncbi:hypothetical protein J5N97_018883 [Dioscorea zingiberensis]|uniref:Uncharacterized protein n=1 Tax=Dioscorea zingiberensis TaxID=325984 RepID=A0A9D5HBX3_9LILI|nr:hypothetical protein J5N97_018883 [Dioscorea zingiberensis]
MASPCLLVLLLILILLLPLLLLWPRPAKVQLKDRHVFGGSSGIGLAMALQAASEGARISILARSHAKLESARDAILQATGSGVTILSVDVQDFRWSVSQVIGEISPIDVLVANHGIFLPQELELQDLEEIRFQVEVNLMGTFHLIKAAMPGMKQNAKNTGLQASITIMSSQAGQVLKLRNFVCSLWVFMDMGHTPRASMGLAEALRHEVVLDNINVSLIFPPNTDTPGLAEEHKRRPELTNMIAASSGCMKADEVAAKALNGIKTGTFIVPCNFEGVMLAIATAGFSPQNSYIGAFVEVIGAGFMRFVGLCFQWNWFRIIEKFYAEKNSKFDILLLNHIPSLLKCKA